MLRVDPELTAARRSLDDDLQRPPDKTLAFFSRMPLLCGAGNVAASSDTCPMHPDVTAPEPGTCPRCGMKLLPSDTSSAPGAWPQAGPAGGGHDYADGLEWEDLIPEITARRTPAT
jgi:hypothetical protein